MFIRMIAKAFARQWKKMAMIAFTIALGASLATAMLSVMMDVGDKISQELKAYGANITVVPKDTSVINDLYDVGDALFVHIEDLLMEKPRISSFDSLDLQPVHKGLSADCTDRRVHAGGIASARQDSDRLD